MTMTAEQARNYILELVEWEKTNGYKTSDLVTEWSNMNAEIDEDGDIWAWIGDDKGSGVWLSDIVLVEFVAWHKERADA